MTDAEKRIRDALAAGPTPGPWRHATYMSGTQNVEFPGARGVTFADQVLDVDAREVCSDWDAKPFPWMDVAHRPEDKGNESAPQRTRNAAYIAACHPAAIRELLAEMDRLRGLLCKCDMRTRLVGDGCEFCNPQLAEELAREQR